MSARAFACLLLVACVPAESPASDHAADVAQLTRQSEAWDKAIVAKDLAGITGNMCDDFRQIGSDGSLSTREAFVKDLVAPDFSIDPYTVEEFQVRIVSDTAFLSGTTRMTGHAEGNPWKTHYRYTDVYVRTAGKWKVCNVQTSRIAD